MLRIIVVRWLYFGKIAHFIYKNFWRNWLKKFDEIDLKNLIEFLINFLKTTLLIVEQGN